MNQIQRISVIGTLLAAANELGIETDLTPLEGAKLQVKLMEFVQQHGETEAEKIMNKETCNLIRALYDEIMAYDEQIAKNWNDLVKQDEIKQEAQMMKDAQEDKA